MTGVSTMSSTATEAYRPWPIKRHRRKQADMEFIKDTIIEVLAEDPPMTVRQVFYQLVTRDVIEKTEKEYKNVVVRLLTEMRLSGEVPWAWIVDQSRRRRLNRTFSNIGEAADDAARLYRKSALTLSEQYVEVWCEKEALAGIIGDVTDEFDVPLMVSKGMPSLTFLYGTAEHVRHYANYDVASVIYQFGDHDPSGVLVLKNLENRLRELCPIADLTVERVALTPLMIQSFNLPTRPTKRAGNHHATGFEGDSVELDALKPRILRGLCRQALLRHIDELALKTLRVAEESERDLIRAWAEQIGSAS